MSNVRRFPHYINKVRKVEFFYENTIRQDIRDTIEVLSKHESARSYITEMYDRIDIAVSFDRKSHDLRVEIGEKVRSEQFTSAVAAYITAVGEPSFTTPQCWEFIRQATGRIREVTGRPS